jgi:hypothetical protein
MKHPNAQAPLQISHGPGTGLRHSKAHWYLHPDAQASKQPESGILYMSLFPDSGTGPPRLAACFSNSRRSGTTCDFARMA